MKKEFGDCPKNSFLERQGRDRLLVSCPVADEEVFHLLGSGQAEGGLPVCIAPTRHVLIDSHTLFESCVDASACLNEPLGGGYLILEDSMMKRGGAVFVPGINPNVMS